MKTKVFFSLMLSVIIFSSFAQSITTDAVTYTPQQLVENILTSNCIQVTNITFTGASSARGYFDATGTTFPIQTGIMLATGDIFNAQGPNSSGSASNSLGLGGDPDLDALIPGYSTFDATILEFDFFPTSDTIEFQYIFGSDEYPEYVGSSFNDVFGLFLSGPGISGPYSNGAINIALIPGTTLPVTINNVNNLSYSQYYVDNFGGTAIEYDGYTVPLTAKSAVIPFETYHIKLAIGDAGDNIIDSGIFFEEGSFSDGVICNSIISGTIYNDINSNCVLDSNETGTSNLKVKVEPGPYYGTTNSTGYYSISVPQDTFTVSQIIHPFWEEICPPSGSYTVVLTDSGEVSSNNDFANEIVIYCPILEVDISTWALRPCMNSIYSVSYCNTGTATADNVYIEVEFDDVVTPISSSIPWSSQNGYVYTFDIGTVSPNQCESYYITAEVSCSAVMGSTHCIEARIYPDTLCFPPDTTWDHSSVAVEGECVGDSSACFTIYNTGDPGSGNMLGPSDYRIYENNVLVYTEQFQLAGGDNLVVCWATNGNAIRLEADQRPGHPGNSHPQETIEDCGDDTGTSLGQIIVIPEDDIDADVEIDCRVVTGSYDPNDKLVKPVGLTSNHYIDSTDVLEYQINFQNTGTDTAFKVIILDTLSGFLDVTTVETGTSSHPYTFRIFGQGILEWKFDNILLPDSIVNEPASHGFVKFKVSQIPGNQKNTIIENNAGIIFDYNAPVITNLVWNIVYDTALIVINEPVIYNNLIDVKVYPNPFNEYTTLRITNSERITNYELKIYDLLGNEVSVTIIRNSDSFVISSSNMVAGMYFYKLLNKKEIIAAGKIIVN